MNQCTAKSKQTGQRCKNAASPGRTTCRFHGGHTPRGIASPQFRHGKYAQDLPVRLLATYQASLADELLLSLKHEIAAVDARVCDLLTRVDSGESGHLWQDLRAARLTLLAARRANNTDAMNTALNQILQLIDTGYHDSVAWHELSTLFDQRRKLVESERKKLVEDELMITAEKATLLVTALLDSVRRNVTEPERLTAIQAEFMAILNRASVHGTDAD